MAWTDADLEDLAQRVDGAFPSLSREDQRIALAVFREMARGEPTAVGVVAERAGARLDDVEDALGRWPGVYRDDAGRIVGFWGLALEGMPHPIRLGGRTLYGWCAWDTLFLGELLGEELRVTSTCAVTGSPVSFTVGTDGVRNLDPGTAVLSFLEPEHADVEGDDVFSSFCHHVLFFSSKETWNEWARERQPTTFPLTVEEGWRLGRMANRLCYGRELETDRTVRATS